MVLVLAVPIAAVSWLVASNFEARERERADKRLIASLRAADAELATILAAADADARGLARAPAVRRAVIRSDTAALARLARSFPGLVVYARGRLLTARLSSDAYVRTVGVLAPGSGAVGRIGIATRLNRELLLRLRERAGGPLLFERSGRVVAGASVAAGGSIVLSGTDPQAVVVGNRRYRAVAALLPGADARLVALVPAEDVQAAADRQLRLVALAGLLTLFLLVVAIDGLTAIVHRRRR